MTATALINLDASLFWFINSHHNAVFDAFFWTVTWLGNGWVAFPTALAIILLKIPKERLKTVLIYAAIALAMSGLLNTAVKKTVKRLRPLAYFAETVDAANPPEARQVHVVGQRLKYGSFPSGHANTVFSVAVLLSVLLGGAFRYAYIPALLTAYSRVYVGVHFPLDVTAGAALAILMVQAVMGVYRLRMSRLDRHMASPLFLNAPPRSASQGR